MVKYVSAYTKGTCKKRSAKDLFNNAYASELHQQVIAIQIGTHNICLYVCLFVCVEVLRPSQPNGVMSSAVSLPNHTFTGQALSSKRFSSIVHILSPETDNCPS